MGNPLRICSGNSIGPRVECTVPVVGPDTADTRSQTVSRLSWHAPSVLVSCTARTAVSQQSSVWELGAISWVWETQESRAIKESFCFDSLSSSWLGGSGWKTLWDCCRDGRGGIAQKGRVRWLVTLTSAKGLPCPLERGQIQGLHLDDDSKQKPWNDRDHICL